MPNIHPRYSIRRVRQKKTQKVVRIFVTLLQVRIDHPVVATILEILEAHNVENFRIEVSPGQIRFVTPYNEGLYDEIRAELWMIDADDLW